MLISAMQRIPALLACLLVLGGCSRDPETLDRFARTYAAFLDAMGDARVASITIILNQEKPGNYWTELDGALDQRASSKARLDHARSAIKVESEIIARRFDAFTSALGNLDREVGQLVETANSVGDREYREDAIAVSQRAREVDTAYTSLDRLYSEGFSHRRDVLRGIIADGGDLVPATFKRFKQDLERNYAIGEEQKAVEQQVTSSLDRLKDAFNTLAGRAKVKTYASKWDDDPPK